MTYGSSPVPSSLASQVCPRIAARNSSWVLVAPFQETALRWCLNLGSQHLPRPCAISHWMARHPLFHPVQEVPTSSSGASTRAPQREAFGNSARARMWQLSRRIRYPMQESSRIFCQPSTFRASNGPSRFSNLRRKTFRVGRPSRWDLSMALRSCPVWALPLCLSRRSPTTMS